MARKRSYSEAPAQSTWLLLGGAAVAALALSQTKTGSALVQRAEASVMGVIGQAFDFTKGQAFALALPGELRPWAGMFLNAAKQYGVDPWVLAGLCYRESLGGVALTPRGSKPPVKNGGPTGTGDFIARTSGAYAKFANPATGLPPDGLGWGRGLMQIDFGAHNAWFASGAGANWGDPQTNINKGAEILKGQLDFFRKPAGSGVMVDCWRLTTGLPQYRIAPWSKYGNVPTCPPGAKTVGPFKDPRPLAGPVLWEAAIAAYNAGPSGALQAVALGFPGEAATTGQDYVSWFTTRVAAWSARMGV